MDFRSERGTSELLPFYEAMSSEGLIDYWRRKNMYSIDGKPTGIFSAPGDPAQRSAKSVLERAENSLPELKNPGSRTGSGRGRKGSFESSRKALISGDDSRRFQRHFPHYFHALGIDPASRGG